MTNKNKYVKIINSALIVIIFIFIAFGSDDSKASGNDNNNTSTTTETVKEDDSCSRCGGSGTVSTYGCDPSHFDFGDCSGGHNSKYNCTPTGHKSCPCCDGSGKSH
jgi:hypothetical protein